MLESLGSRRIACVRPMGHLDEALCVDDTITMGVQVNGKARGEITISKDADQEAAMTAARDVDKVQAQLKDKDIKKIIYVPGRILNIVAK